MNAIGPLGPIGPIGPIGPLGPIGPIDQYDTYLLSSILLETVATAFIKRTNTNKIWFIPVYFCYISSFYLFPKSLVKYELSVAYPIWC